MFAKHVWEYQDGDMDLPRWIEALSEMSFCLKLYGDGLYLTDCQLFEMQPSQLVDREKDQDQLVDREKDQDQLVDREQDQDQDQLVDREKDQDQLVDREKDQDQEQHFQPAPAGQAGGAAGPRPRLRNGGIPVARPQVPNMVHVIAHGEQGRRAWELYRGLRP